MTHADRDRLVALNKAKDQKMTRRQAAEELKLSERQVRRLLVKLKREGDQAVIHGLRGRSNRRIDEETRQKAVKILRLPGVRADAGGGVPGKYAPTEGEQRNGAAMDAASGTVAEPQTEGGGGHVWRSAGSASAN